MQSNLFSLFTSLLFDKPKTCSLCQRPYPSSRSAASSVHLEICPTCRQGLLPIQDPICPICGREKEGSSQFDDQDELCFDCRARKGVNTTFFLMNRSSLHYTPKAKEWLYAYKYRGRESLSSGLVQLLAGTYRRYYAHLSIEAITYVPLHEERLQERTFNQAEQLAIGLGGHLNLPVYALLHRLHSTAKQSRMTRHERMIALEGIFRIKSDPNLPKGRRILLIDDVYTTGTTVNQSARALREGGWEEVYVLTPFRA